MDFNQNGLSDIWEKHYNHGVLFPSAFDPNLDPDGDGMSSLLEATAGTDPFNPNPPYGIVATTLEKQPAMMMLGDIFSGPYLRPAMMKMSWQTILGKRYWLQHSDNLLASGWSEPAYFSTGDGSIADSFSPLTDWNHSPINRRFMRVKIDDVDDDSDQLTNYEEGLLGSDAAEGDTDGDLVGDGDEMIRFFTNPLTAFDLDADGILDDFEKLRASQILAINSDSVFWGNYYQGLAQGNLDGTFDYFYTSVPTLS